MAITNKYRINITMEWENETVRDNWFTKLKTAYATIKQTETPPTVGIIVKDEYGVPDRLAESL